MRGETGRHAGLKIRYPKGYRGSNPLAPTKMDISAKLEREFERMVSEETSDYPLHWEHETKLGSLINIDFDSLHVPVEPVRSKTGPALFLCYTCVHGLTGRVESVGAKISPARP